MTVIAVCNQKGGSGNTTWPSTSTGHSRPTEWACCCWIWILRAAPWTGGPPHLDELSRHTC